MEGVPDSAPPTSLLAEVAQRLAALEVTHKELLGKVEQAEKERDEYRRVYLALLEAYRKLEMGLFGQKRERFTDAYPSGQRRTERLEGGRAPCMALIASSRRTSRE